MELIYSVDGTPIAFDRVGMGAPLVIVGGAFSYRTFPLQTELARILSDRFEVISYDRRGRGDSGDMTPYSVEREVEDLEALIGAVGGTAHVWGMSSGGALALRAAAAGVPIRRLAIYDPPFVVTPDRIPPHDLLDRVETALRNGDTNAAVRVFIGQGMGAPAIALAMLRMLPVWKRLRSTAHTIPYDIRVMGENLRGEPLSTPGWDRIDIPVLVNVGAKTGPSREAAAQAVVAALPNARLGILPGQGVGFRPTVVAGQLRAFLDQDGAGRSPARSPGA